MELIITNVKGKEMDFPSLFSDIDMEIGGDSKNDFEYTISKEEYNEELHSVGCRIFVPNTEYGGIFEKRSVKKSGDIVLSGKTWRGILTTKVIKPPVGEAYLTVSGDANHILENITAGLFGNLIKIKSEESGIHIASYQFKRYVKLLEGIEEMLESAGARLNITYNQGAPNEVGYVLLEAVPVHDYSEDIEISEDLDMQFDITEDYSGVNHLVCLGKGELQERIVLDLYVQEDGTIGTEQFYFGENEIEETYDYPNVESTEELREGGIKRLKELMNYKRITPYIESDMDIAIGDIVGGRERTIDAVVKVPVVKKIIRIKDGTVNIEYDLKGEEKHEDS